MNGLLLELFAVALLTISGLFGGSLVLEDRVGMAEPHAHADRGGAGARARVALGEFVKRLSLKEDPG
jgi:hypothetical protein